MSDNITIDSIELPPDLQWIDEYGDGSDLVGQIVTPTITGALVIQTSAQQGGRRITLQGRQDGDAGFAAIARSVVEDLRTLAAAIDATHTLTFSDGRTYDVVFRRDDGPAIEASPLMIVDPPADDDLYYPTIRLMQV